MNIFVLDNDPYIAATYHADKHVVKMIVESAQLLSTAHRVLDGHEAKRRVLKTGNWRKTLALPDWRDISLYQSTHVNHPCAIWCRETTANYDWLWQLLDGLCEEYYIRYGSHKKVPQRHRVETSKLLDQLKVRPFKITQSPQTEFALAMPDNVKLGTAVDSYRNYYLQNKAALLAYTHRPVPAWIPASAGARQLP